jgi:hypothetical protein
VRAWLCEHRVVVTLLLPSSDEAATAHSARLVLANYVVDDLGLAVHPFPCQIAERQPTAELQNMSNLPFLGGSVENGQR